MRGRRVWLALGVLLLLAIGGAVLVPLVRGATSDAAARPSTKRLFACAEMAPGDGYCDRLTDDLARRVPLSESDRAAAGPFVEQLREALVVSAGARCPQPSFCVFTAPPTASALRATFVAAGFPAPVVRTARYTDPAPADAIVYGVRAGAACLLGWVDGVSGSPPQTVGRLRDGACLPP